MARNSRNCFDNATAPEQSGANRKENEMKLIAGRNNLAVTLFVPWDCGNNCPFCTTKQEYKDQSNFSLINQIITLLKIWCVDDVKDVVITGGEPLANIDGLKELLTAIYSMATLKKKKIYINTSMHDLDGRDAESYLQFFTQFKDVIKGVNVSEHISFNLAKGNGILLDILHLCKIPVKLNCVLTGKERYNDLFEFVYKWQKQVDTISFRKDYRAVRTDDELRAEDATLLMLKDIWGDYTSGGCEVCNDDVFKGGKVHYHRGKESTLIDEKTCLIVNDIIVKQDGSLYLDWGNQHPINPLDLISQWQKKIRCSLNISDLIAPPVSICESSSFCGYRTGSCGYRTGGCGGGC